MGETVRFAEVIRNAGTPGVYLPLSDPRQDANFMRAVREERVLSLKQEPTGTRKDFGTVGYLAERFVSYLVFPRSLAAFRGKRIIGIKYDVLQQADLSTPAASSHKRSDSKARARDHAPARVQKPKPRPRHFVALVRRVATTEIRLVVDALTEPEARRKAELAARAATDVPLPRIATEVVSVRAEAESEP